MKKTKKMIIMLLITLFSVIKMISPTNSAVTAQIEIYFELAGKEINIENLDKIVGTSRGVDYVEINLMVKSKTSNTYPISALDFELDFSKNNKITELLLFNAEINPDTNNAMWIGSAKGKKISLAMDSDNGDDEATDYKNLLITSTGKKLATIRFKYDKNGSDTDFHVLATPSTPVGSFGYVDKNSGATLSYDNGLFDLKGLVIGNPGSSPDSTLKDLSIKGDSGKEYISSLSPNMEIELSYQDSMNPLVILPWKNKSSAKVTITGEKSNYSDDDVITIIVEDDGADPTEYKVTIKVKDANTNNDLKTLTATGNNLSWDKSFSPSVTDYTITVPYSTTKVNLAASIDSLNLSTLDKTSSEVNFTTTEVGEKIVKFTVTSEAGVNKEYTVKVIRKAGSSNTDITVSVDGTALTKNSDKYIYELLETKGTFVFVIKSVDDTQKLSYRLSTDTSYISVTSGSSISHSSLINKNDKVTYDIKVISENGAEVVYQLEVSRPASSSVELDTVKIDATGKSVATDNDSSYSVNISGVLGTNPLRYEHILQRNIISALKVTLITKENAVAKLLDADGSLIVNGNIDISKINKGDNQFYIEVSAQNGIDSIKYPLIIKLNSDEKEIVEATLNDIDKTNDEIIKIDGFTQTGTDYIYRFSYEKTNMIRLNLKTSEKSTITRTSGVAIVGSGNSAYADFSFTKTTEESQELVIIVTAENGTPQTYKFTLIREKASTDSSLSDLKVSDKTISGFSSGKTSGYDRIVLDPSNTSVNVLGTPSSLLANVTYRVGNGSESTDSTISLTRGQVANVYVTVTAQSGAKTTYSFEVIAASNENTITNITLDGIPLVFNANTTTYTLTVPYTKNSTKITIEGSEYSTPTGNGDWVLSNYGNDKNIKKVYITSESGKKGQEYVIEIIRNNPDEANYLATLEIKDGTGNTVFQANETTLKTQFEFNNNGNYYIVGKDVSSINLSATLPSGSLAKITTQIGTKTLNPAGPTPTVITVSVQSEKGETREYKVHIKRGDNDKTFENIVIDGKTYDLTHFNGDKKLIITPDYTFNMANVSVKINRNNTIAEIVSSGITFNASYEGTWILKEGKNIFTFRIKSQIAEVGEEYTVEVNKAKARTEKDIEKIEVIYQNNDILNKTNPYSGTYELNLGRGSELKVLVLVSLKKSQGSSLTTSYKSKDITNTTLDVYTIELALKAGDITSLSLVVKAEDGTSSTPVNISISNKNNESEITDITIDEVTSYTFNKDEKAVNLGTFGFEVKTLTVSAILKDAVYAKVKINGQIYDNDENATVMLSSGSNKSFTVQGVADDGTLGDLYTFSYFQETAKNNKELESLEIWVDGETIDLINTQETFGKTKILYNLNVDRSITTFVMKASVLASNKSKLNLGTKQENGTMDLYEYTSALSSGANTIKLIVTGQDGTSQTVTININVANDDHEIIDVEIEQLPGFNYDKTKDVQSIGAFNYTDYNNGKIRIKVTYNDTQYAKLTVNGTQRSNTQFEFQLEQGANNRITFVLTSERGNQTTRTITYSRLDQNGDNTLKTLSVKVDSGLELVSTIEDKLTFRVNRDSQKVFISAAVNNMLSKITGSANNANGYTLKASDINTYTITVTAENGDKKDYVVEIITKNDDKEVNNIIVDGKDLSDITKDASGIYQLGTYPFATKEISIIIEPSDDKAISYLDNVKKDTYTFKYTLKPNNNTFTLYVESEYGTKGTIYTFAYKQELASNKAQLKTLEAILDNKNIILDENNQSLFNPTVLTIVPIRVDRRYETETINIQAVADFNGTITNGASISQALQLGLNTFTVTVVSEDTSSTATYTLRIYVADDNNEITDIKVQGINLNPLFDKAETNYEITAPFKWNVSEVMVDVTASNKFADITGKGRQAIAYKENTIVVTSRSEYRKLIDDDSKDLTYNIKVTREEPFKDINLSDLYIMVDGNKLPFTAPIPEYKDGTYVYSISLDKDIEYTSVYIHAIVKNQKQRLESLDGVQIDEKHYLPFMVTPIREIYRFKVVAEDGASREYTINITQGTTIGTDNSIQSVVLRDYIGVTQYLTGNLAFDPANKIYNITVGNKVSSVELTVKPTDTKASVTGNGQHYITGDSLTIEFYVTAENGSEGEHYKINITKDAASSDATLKDLIVTDNNGTEYISKDNSTITFNPATNRYELRFDRSIDELNIDAIKNDSNATISGDLGNIILSPGNNTIRVYVVAEDGKTRKNYQIQVIIANTTIEVTDLYVDGLDFIDPTTKDKVIFDKDTRTYNLGKLANDVTSLNIIGTISDQYGTIEGIGFQSVRTGTNTIIIKAQSEDKKVTEVYQIVYEKDSTGGSNTPKSSDATLTNLEVQGTKRPYNINFDEANQGPYKIELDFEDASLFLKSTIHPRATITGDGFHNLAEGETKTITVQVTAEDGTLGKVYTLEVSRKKASTDNTLLDLYVEANGIIHELDVNKTYQEVNVLPTTNEVTFGGTKPEFSKISGLGKQTLESTLNVFPITVISQTGEVKTYNVAIKKQNNDASLRDLTVLNEKDNQVLDLSPTFDKGTLNYVIDLTDRKDVTDIRITAIANGSAKIKGTGVFTLKSGSGKVTDRYVVTVTAEDNITTLDYIVTIEREINAEDSITIDDLTLIGDMTIYLGNDKHQDALNQFNMSQTTYNITVPYALKSVILSLSNKEGATIYGTGSYELKDETTVITFRLVSKSGKVTSDTYTINITKEEASSDATLKQLTLDGVLVENFDKEVFEYTKKVKLEDYKNIVVAAIANNKYAKVSGNLGSVNISRGNNNINITVMAEDGTEKNYKVTLIALSDLNEITDLKVTGQILNPDKFDKDTPVYRLNVSYTTDTIAIEAKASDYSVITGLGIKSLVEGENIFYVYATSEFGTQGKVYQVIVTRDEISDDATLKSLTVRENSHTGDIIDFKPVFDRGITNYIINLPAGASLSTIFIEAEANNMYAIVGGIGYKVLKAETDGDYQNVFEIVVRAQTGKTLTYTVSVYRNVNLSDLAEYESLELKGSDGIVYLGTNTESKVSFNKLTTTYMVEVPFNVKSVTLNAKALYGSVYGNETLTFKNSNELTFTSYVVSQSGVTTLGKYTIKVIREIAKTENTLTNLTIDNVQVPNFDPAKNAYEISIPVGSKQQVTLGATASDSSMTITGLGTKTLKPGKNVYSIEVMAQDGTINTYTITINYVSNNALLDTLEVKGTDQEVFNKDTAIDYLKPEDFDNTTLKHKVILDKNVRKVQLTGTTQDQEGAMVAGFLTYDFPLDQASKTVYVEVTSATGEKLVYEIELVRKDKLDNNSELMSLTVGGRQLAFNPKNYSYELNVGNDTKSISLSAETFSPNSTITVRGYTQAAKKTVTLPINDLANGQNVIVLEVTSEDGTMSIYTLTVLKDAPQDFLFLILLIASLLLWIITVLYIVVKRSKEKNKEKNEVIF